MKNIPCIYAAMVLCVLMNGCAGRQAVNALMKSSQDWLALIDAGSYGESWDQASTSFQETVSRTDWESFMTSERAPLGGVVKRSPANKKETASAGKDLQKGEFSVVEFATDFEKKSGAKETVMAIPQPDGTWKISAYYLE